ncbi:MAG: hypothetical protein QM776_14540 [Rhodocyclaceae bacterium]
MAILLGSLVASAVADDNSCDDFNTSTPPFRPGQVWELGFVYADREPPLPRAEAVPLLQPGYRWAAGYWTLRQCRFVWISGRLLADRPGHAWQDPQWEPWESGWRMRPGQWVRWVSIPVPVAPGPRLLR